MATEVEVAAEEEAAVTEVEAVVVVMEVAAAVDTVARQQDKEAHGLQRAAPFPKVRLTLCAVLH